MSTSDSSGLRRFRVVIKRGTHPTTSLTLRCVDVQADSEAAAVAQFAKEARQGLHVKATIVQPWTPP